MDPMQERPPPMTGMAPDGITGIVLWAVFSLFLAPLALVLRFWARRIKNSKTTWNDWFAVVGWIFLLPLGAVITEAVVNAGLGAHIWLLPNPEEQIPHNLKDLIAYQLLWAGSNTFVRLSILHLYYVIFRTRSFRLGAQILMGITVTFYVGVILLIFLYCIPFEANWNTQLPGAKCGNLHASGISTGTINLAIDAAIVCLPMPALWGLQLPMRKKLGLVCIFGIGVFILALSIVRVVSLAALGPDSDLTYAMNKIGWWSIMEPSLGVINCCLPVLQPVVNKVIGGSSFSRNRSTRSGTGDRMYGQKSIQVVTEHSVVHWKNEHDDDIPLQANSLGDCKYVAEVQMGPPSQA